MLWIRTISPVSPSSRGRGLKFIFSGNACFIFIKSPSSRGRGLKLQIVCNSLKHRKSPSSRGRGLKYHPVIAGSNIISVALFTRAWIEIFLVSPSRNKDLVALFTRAWIEIIEISFDENGNIVALFTRAWIEMTAPER